MQKKTNRYYKFNPEMVPLNSANTIKLYPRWMKLHIHE